MLELSVFPVHPDTVHPGSGTLFRVPDALPIIGTVFDPPIYIKITVMIKGDYPTAPSPDISDLILDVPSTQLSTPFPDPVMWRAHVNCLCIQTYTVGHRGQMEELVNGTKEVWKSWLGLGWMA
jgi:hypothetical protein